MESNLEFMSQLESLKDPQCADTHVLIFYLEHSETLLSLVKSQKYRVEGEPDGLLLEVLIGFLARVVPIPRCPLPEILVMTNNILNLASSSVYLLIQNERALGTICSQFEDFCRTYQDKVQSGYLNRQEESELNFRLYSNLHLFSVLLGESYKRPDNPMLSKLMCSKTVVSAFLSVDLREIKKAEIHRLCSVIMVFFTKKLDLKKWGGDLRRYTLDCIKYMGNKSKQNMVNCLKKIVPFSPLTTLEIRKHNIVNFLLESLVGETNDHYIADLLQLTWQIIQHNTQVHQQFYNRGLITQITKSFNKNPTLGASIIQKLLHCISASEQEQLYSRFESSLSKDPFQKSIVRCLCILTPNRSLLNTLKSIDSGLLNHVRQPLVKTPTYNTVSLLLHFYGTILQKLKMFNQELAEALSDKITLEGGLDALWGQCPEFRGVIERFRKNCLSQYL